jgi:hypothetical protein
MGLASVELVVVAIVGFIAVNAISYLKFQRAWHIGDRLTPDELRQIATTCAEIEKRGHQRLTADEIPAPFEKLKARSATFYPGASDFRLYGVGECGVWMRISTSKQDQEISVFTNFLVPQGNVVLWHKDPAFAAPRQPTGRLVTVSEHRMHGGREWIVLPDEIRVIDRNHFAGGADSVVASVPLSESCRQKIVAAIAAIPSEIRGREYTSGAADGLNLHLAFSDDGHHAADDIGLANTWRDEVGPLIDSVSACLPAKDAIAFKAVVTEIPFDPRPQFSSTWAELAEGERRLMPVPWWCVWPRFIGR